MARSYSKRDLYGGAITVEIPSDFIDTSSIRQIPDHQEVYLSPSTLSSLIFEINTYQSPSDEIESSIQARIQSQIQSRPLPPDSSTDEKNKEEDENNNDSDRKASLYHFLDPILPPDTLDPRSVLYPPRRVLLGSNGLKSYPAYVTSGMVISAEVDKKASSALPREWAQTPAMTNCQVKVFQLLVRMEKYGTDFCVRANVPLKEFVGNKEKEEEELRLIEDVVNRVVNTLDVVDFELFGEEE